MTRDADFASTLANYVGQANYAAGLDSTGLIPTAQLATGATSTSVFYRGDRTFAPPGSGGKVSGDLVQMVISQVQGVTTTSGWKANDNTAFLLSNGNGFGLAVNMKPVSSLNKVYARGDFYAATNDVGSGGGGVVWGFFVGSSTVATITGTFLGENTVVGEVLANHMAYAGFQWQVPTVSTATTNYTVRLAATALGDAITLNGEASVGKHNNSVMSSLTVWEVAN